MKQKIINQLLELAYQEGIDEQFFERNSGLLSSAKITKEKFLVKYNSNVCESLLSVIKTVGYYDPHGSLQTNADFWAVFNFSYYLKYLYNPSESLLSIIIDLFENLVANYVYATIAFRQSLPPDVVHWGNHIQFYIISDRKVAIEKYDEVYFQPDYRYLKGYLDYSEGRFSGLINYLYEKGFNNLFERTINVICDAIRHVGPDVVFMTVCLLNFLKEKEPLLYQKVYNAFEIAKREFNGTNWNDSLWFLCGVERYSLKSTTKNLTIEGALKL